MGSLHFELTDFWKCVTGIPNPNNPNDIYVETKEKRKSGTIQVFK
jgi:hypothetical protein